jgi:hypothetical protein
VDKGSYSSPRKPSNSKLNPEDFKDKNVKELYDFIR